jgi:hypothetical protein
MNKGVLVFVVVILTVAGLLGAHVLLANVQQEQIASQYMTQAELEQLIADQRLVALSGLLSPTSLAGGALGSDAGAVLNPFIHLDGGGSEMQTPLEKAEWMGRRIREQVKGPKEKRPRTGETQTWRMRPETLPDVDVTILQTLLEYETWNPSSPPGRYHDYLESADLPLQYNSPIPNLIDFQTVVKLRLAQGLLSGEILPALQEVRHLAQLTLRVEELVSTMVGVALLRVERLAYTRAVELALIQPEEWTPPSTEVIDAMRRLGLSMVVVSSGWTESLDAISQIREAVPSPFGLCGGLRDAVVMWNLVYPVWSGLPLERTFSGQGDALRRRVDAAEGCRLSMVRDELAHPERMSMEAWRQSNAASFNKGYSAFWETVPFVRVHLFLDVLAEAGPMSGYNQYRARPSRRQR